MKVPTFLTAVGGMERAFIYHAAQLRDLRRYAVLGHVASRAELFENSADTYTPFESDKDDQGRMDCASDVFGNLLDQNRFIANGRGIPNAYGPVTLVFKAEALRNAGTSDVLIRSKAIWSANPEGRRVLETRAEIHGLYYDARGWARSGEIQIVSGTLHLEDLIYVLVNPIEVNGTDLVAAVTATLKPVADARGRLIPVRTRSFRPETYGRSIYDSLVTWAADAPENGGEIESLPDELAAWFETLQINQKSPNLKRFANYLSHGTLSALRDKPGHLQAQVAFFSADNDDYEYDLSEFEWDDEKFRLSEDQLFERDEAIEAVDRAESRYRHALDDDVDAVETEEALRAAWDDFLDALGDLNEWIASTRRCIIDTRDEFHLTAPDAHDSEESAAMTSWADEFEEIDIPEGEPGYVNIDGVEWRAVREYADASVHL